MRRFLLLDAVVDGIERSLRIGLRRLQHAGSTKPKPPRSIDPDILKLQDDLGAKLAARVQLKHSASGRGQLVISYNNLDELDGILAHIK